VSRNLFLQQETQEIPEIASNAYRTPFQDRDTEMHEIRMQTEILPGESRDENGRMVVRDVYHRRTKVENLVKRRTVERTQ